MRHSYLPFDKLDEIKRLERENADDADDVAILRDQINARSSRMAAIMQTWALTEAAERGVKIGCEVVADYGAYIVYDIRYDEEYGYIVHGTDNYKSQVRSDSWTKEDIDADVLTIRTFECPARASIAQAAAE